MTRDMIERVVREAYAARVAGDLDRTMRHFADGAHYALAGSQAASAVPAEAIGHAAVREVMRRLIDGFQFVEAQILHLVVENDSAAVHSRLRVRTASQPEPVTTEVFDLIRFEGDKIASFRQFADTALANRLLGH